jgi:hypothetical protein
MDGGFDSGVFFGQRYSADLLDQAQQGLLVVNAGLKFPKSAD